MSRAPLLTAAAGRASARFIRRRSTALILSAYALALLVPGLGCGVARTVMIGEGPQASWIPDAMLVWALAMIGAGVEARWLGRVLRRPASLPGVLAAAPVGLALGSVTTFGDLAGGLAGDLGRMTSAAGTARGLAIVFLPGAVGVLLRVRCSRLVAASLPVLRVLTVLDLIGLSYIQHV